MSGDSRDSYRETFRYVAPEVRKEKVFAARSKVAERSKAPRVVRDETKVIDGSLARREITRPAPGVQRIHVVLVDNSGSNRAIASHLKKSSGYLTKAMEAIDPKAQIAFVYVSDHCDGPRGLMQEVDFVSPDDTGDKVLASTISGIRDAGGGDEPEAIECALKRACEIDFGEATERHLYLVTDVVAHGMGMDRLGHYDDGCPDQQDWRSSVRLVGKTYTSFEVIGCGADSEVMELQKQFLAPERVPWDLIDLSLVKETKHRQAITGNALLFLMARHAGTQTLKMFLGCLYEKWLRDPVFGVDTDRRAKEMIQRFGKFIELPKDEVDRMMEDILI